MTTVSTVPAVPPVASVPPVPPVRRSILIRADVDTCWAAVTERIGAWWPLLGHSCSDDPGAALAFVDGELVETGPDGTRWVWGTVLRWEPPHGLLMTWHPGRPVGAADATEVEWRVTEVDPATTLVEVVHRGWERLTDPRAARTSYDEGWPEVVAALAAWSVAQG